MECLLLAGCSSKRQPQSNIPDWLLTYDAVSELHRHLTDEFQLDCTRFNGTERRLYQAVQNLWSAVPAVRSDMMMENQHESFDVIKVLDSYYLLPEFV